MKCKITYILFLCFISFNGMAKWVNIKPAIQETDLKIADSNVIFYMANADIIKYIAKADKDNKTNNQAMIKKMKGICFSQINLNKVIDDKDITLITQLLKSDILVRALADGKVAMRLKKSSDSILKIEEKIENTDTSDKYTYSMQDGTILFIGSKKRKEIK